MKNPKLGWKHFSELVKNFAYALLGLGGIIIANNCLQAQTTAPDSILQIIADEKQLTIVPPDQLPRFGAGATYWLVLPAGKLGCISVPMPTPLPALKTYQAADGQFIVDGVAGEVVNPQTLEAQAASVVNLINQIQGNQGTMQASRAMGVGMPNIPGFGSNGSSGGTGCPNGLPHLTIDTNRLWLQMISVTNQTASLVIHPPWNASATDVYELLYSTNLAAADSWRWLLRSNPQETNLLVPNATDAQGFYRLSSPNDTAASSSLGTNFWVGFCEAYYDGNNVLSLAISSPSGAAGTVFIPGILTNGPIVVVTNCGDAAVNGTYVLTILTDQETNDWAAAGYDTDGSNYENGTNWIVVLSGGCYLTDYEPDTGNITLLYDYNGYDLNATTNDWQNQEDTNSPPSTICNMIPFRESFSVAAGSVTNVSIPLSVINNPGDFDGILTNGIQVASSQPVSVYGLNYDPFASMAFTGYPTTLLGTNYCIMARPAFTSAATSKLAVLATEDNTTVWITPSPTADLIDYPATTAYQTNLQAGETYQNCSYYGDDDVTGTWITSDKPVAVFAGADIADVPDSETQSGNPLMQEQLPVDSWGQEVLALSFAGRTNGDSYRILAAYDNTVITITGIVVTPTNEPGSGPWAVTATNQVVVVTNQAGQFYDLILDGPVEFQASQPIQVAQFANGGCSDHQIDPANPSPDGDPCEVLLPPVGHCLMTNIFVTLTNDLVTGDFAHNYLNIIVAQSAVANTLVDGLAVASTNFAAIGASGFYGAQLTITNSGTHTVTSTQPVSVVVYGFGPWDAYGYFGGVVK